MPVVDYTSEGGRRIVARRGIISGRCVIGIVRRRLIIYRRWINRWRRYEHRKAEADKDARMSWVRQSGYETKNNAERRNRQRTADATTSRCSVHAPTLRFQMLLHVTGGRPVDQQCALALLGSDQLWNVAGPLSARPSACAGFRAHGATPSRPSLCWLVCWRSWNAPCFLPVQMTPQSPLPKLSLCGRVTTLPPRPNGWRMVWCRA